MCAHGTLSATGLVSSQGLLWPVEAADRASLRNGYPVSPALTPFVERYWTVQWDRRGQAGYRSEVLSHPAVNLTVEAGDAPRHGHPLPAALVHGIVTRRFTIDLHDRGVVVAAKFRPGGFTALTGLPVPRDTVCRAAGMLGNSWDGIRDEVLAEPSDADRVAVLDAVLASLATLAQEPPAAYLLLLDVLGQMMHDRSLTRVDDSARRVGLGSRQLQRLFRDYVGVSPKWVLRRYRLQDAAALIDAGATDLPGLAADLGWFDQAHFCRDFHASVGLTPSAYAARTRAAAAVGADALG